MNTPLPDPRPSPWESLTRSPFVRLGVVGFLVICLQIPVLFIYNLVTERNQTRHEAVDDITSKWGRGQEVYGPFLVIPYSYVDVEKDSETEKERFVERTAVATFLPEDLRIASDLETEVRHRGIFEAPVYSASTKLEGRFLSPDFGPWKVEARRIDWQQAQLVFEVSDVHAVQNRTELNWAGEQMSFEPGAGLFSARLPGFHSPVAVTAESEELEFAVEFDLKGSFMLRFAPLAKNTEATLRADWADPSFQGAYLPTTSDVRPDGFEATWRIPHLGRNYPQSWTRTTYAEAIKASSFGFDLLTPVDAYRQTDRSLKYQLLFLGLTFLTIWLFEVLGGARLHPIQYLLIGSAMCIFYLLELSLSEQLAFPVAYCIASTLVVALVFFYARSALDSRSRAFSVTGVLAGLYGCLYVLLQIQDYALLAGSIGLFLILAVVMFATRKVDWYSAKLVSTGPKMDPAAATRPSEGG